MNTIELGIEKLVLGGACRVYIAPKTTSLFAVYEGTLEELQGTFRRNEYEIKRVVLSEATRHNCRNDPTHFDIVTLELEGKKYEILPRKFELPQIY